MAARTSTSAQSTASLFPGVVEPRGELRTVPNPAGGRDRALPGTRSSKTTTFALNELVEKVLEGLTSSGYGPSNSATVRRALVAEGLKHLGEDEMKRLGWEETPKA